MSSRSSFVVAQAAVVARHATTTASTWATNAITR